MYAIRSYYGPTHQPIEHLSQFRALPNFYTFRPADASENIESWRIALKMSAPTAFVCSRQGLEVLKDERAFGTVANGGYLLKKRDDATVTLMASGSEVMLALQTACELAKDGINANIVSVPCFDLLLEQDKEYINTIIEPNTKVVITSYSIHYTKLYELQKDLLSLYYLLHFP